MSSRAQAPSKAATKSSGEEDSQRKNNNVTVGTITDAKAAENEGTSATDKFNQDQRYVYRDFSQIPEEDFDVDYEIDQEGLLKVSFGLMNAFDCKKMAASCITSIVTWVDLCLIFGCWRCLCTHPQNCTIIGT